MRVTDKGQNFTYNEHSGQSFTFRMIANLFRVARCRKKGRAIEINLKKSRKMYHINNTALNISISFENHK